MRDIPKFEKLTNIKINEFGWEENKDFVIYSSRDRTCENVVNLMMVSEGDKHHFMWIKTFSRLKQSGEHSNGTRFYCTHCMEANFESEEKLSQHKDVCMQHEAVRCVYPKEGENKMKFTNQQNTFMHPFFVTADFESTLVPCVVDDKSNAFVYQKHIPNSFALKFECIHDQYSKPIIINNGNPDELMMTFVKECEN